MADHYRKKTLELLIVLLVIFTIILIVSLIDFFLGTTLLDLNIMDKKIEDFIVLILSALCIIKIGYEILRVEDNKELKNHLNGF